MSFQWWSIFHSSTNAFAYFSFFSNVDAMASFLMCSSVGDIKSFSKKNFCSHSLNWLNKLVCSSETFVCTAAKAWR